jgi:hypothetical protein
MPPLENQSDKQKMIAFAQSEHVGIVIALLRECLVKGSLVGEDEFKTIVNAVTMDAQSNVILAFIQKIDDIKKGSLHNQP